VFGDVHVVERFDHCWGGFRPVNRHGENLDAGAIVIQAGPWTCLATSLLPTSRSVVINGLQTCLADDFAIHHSATCSTASEGCLT